MIGGDVIVVVIIIVPLVPFFFFLCDGWGRKSNRPTLPDVLAINLVSKRDFFDAS